MYILIISCIKSDVINTLVTQSIKISNKYHVDLEIGNLAKVFRINGYDDGKFRNIIYQSRGECHVKQHEDREGAREVPWWYHIPSWGWYLRQTEFICL